MARFQSTTINRLDKKGRASVPAAFRKELEDQGLQRLYARIAPRHPAIECFGRDWADKTQARLDRLEPGTDEYDDAALLFFAEVHELAFDPEGRILLPQALIAHAKLSDRAAFVGLGDHFAIWESSALEAHKAAARAREAERQRAQGER